MEFLAAISQLSETSISEARTDDSSLVGVIGYHNREFACYRGNVDLSNAGIADQPAGPEPAAGEGGVDRAADQGASAGGLGDRVLAAEAAELPRCRGRRQLPRRWPWWSGAGRR
jgi:hypothetical protein